MAGLAVAYVVLGFAGDETGAWPIVGPLETALTLLFAAEFASRF